MTDLLSSFTDLFQSSSEEKPKEEEDPRIDLDTFDKLSPEDMNKYGTRALGLNEDYFNYKLLADDGSGQKFRELEFFVRNDGKTEDTFFEHVSQHCHTNIGKLYLKLMLLNVTKGYTNNVNTINFKYTVEAIKGMIADMKSGRSRTWIHNNDGLPGYDMKTAPHTLDEVLKMASSYESEALSLYQPDGDELKQILDTIFFSNQMFEFLNYQENLMGLYYAFAIYVAPAYCLVAPLVIAFTPYIILKYVLGLNISLDMWIKTLKDTFLKPSGMLKMVETGANKYNDYLSKDEIKGKYGLAFRMGIKILVLTIKLINSGIGRYSYVVLLAVCYMYAAYNTINQSRALNKVMKYFHKKLHAVYWSTRLVKHMGDRKVIDYAAITGHHFDVSDIIKEGEYFDDLIKNQTICDNYWVLSGKGSITTMYKRLRDQFELPHNILNHVMGYIAVVDCHHAIAKLYYELEKQGKPVSFAQFIFSSATDNEDEEVDISMFNRPMLFIDNVHNICCDEAICNNVKYDGKNTVVITGPNGSGKSTYIKAIMESIIMAQTFGISFASEMTLTPFTYLTTYLNIPDCQGKESLFQAEMSRCHQFLSEMDEHEEDYKIGDQILPMFSFNIVDEIFVSTNYKEGISAAAAVINKLAKYNKCLNIVITHFDLKEVCKDNVDYKYFTIEDNLDCDYKIRDGVNDKHMALKLLKQRGFDNELVNEATEIYEELFIEKPEISEEDEVEEEEKKIEEEDPKRLKGG